MLTLTSRSSRRSEKAGNGDEDRRGGSARASEPQGTALLRGAGTAGVGADLGGAEGVSGICRRAGSAHPAVLHRGPAQPDDPPTAPMRGRGTRVAGGIGGARDRAGAPHRGDGGDGRLDERRGGEEGGG